MICMHTAQVKKSSGIPSCNSQGQRTHFVTDEVFPFGSYFKYTIKYHFKQGTHQYEYGNRNTGGTVIKMCQY